MNEAVIAGNKPSEELLDLDFALTKLSKLNDRLSTVVECKFLAAMKEEETCTLPGCNRSYRSKRLAKSPDVSVEGIGI